MAAKKGECRREALLAEAVSMPKIRPALRKKRSRWHLLHAYKTIVKSDKSGFHQFFTTKITKFTKTIFKETCAINPV
jgi:hypothetical protein